MLGIIQYTTPLFFTALISAVLAVAAWARRAAPGALWFAAAMLSVAFWATGYAFELAASTLPAKILLAKLEYLGIVLVPVNWLFFALDYTGRGTHLKLGRRLLLLFMPVLTLGLVWSNELHGLIWQSTELRSTGPMVTLEVSYGAGFWVHTLYSYILLLVATILLVSQVLRSARLYRSQSGLLLLGAFAPWLGNVLYVLGGAAAIHLDLTPFAFTVTGLAFGWSILRSRLLDIVPVARDALIERMSDGVIVLNAQSLIVDINPAACAIIGRSSSQVIGQPASQVFARRPDLVERYGDAHELRAEIVIGSADAPQTYDLAITPIVDRHGGANGRLVVLRNISERKQAEQLLQEQNAYLMALHDTALALVNRRDPNNVLETIVARASQLLAAPNGFLFIVDPVEQVLVAEVGVGQFSELRGFKVRRGECAAGRAWADDKMMLVDDYQSWEGRLRALEPLKLGSVLVSPLHSGTAVLGVLGLAYDERGHTFGDEVLRVLERFGQLAALAIDNARLFDSVQTLYDEQRELAEQLRSAKEQAESANLAKTEFISFVSHELRNPMTAMRGYIDLLKLGVGGSLTTQQVEIIDAVRLNTDLMIALVADLIDVARIEAGRLSLNCTGLSLHDVAQAAAQAVQAQLSAKQQQLAIQVPADLPLIWADPVRLAQILANLLNNANKYTPSGGHIALTAELDSPAGAAPAVHVVVHDTGIGISPEEQAKIFQHFFRSADPAAREAPGTGLGLTITRALVELQGGQIWFESTLQVGTTFHFTLPLASHAHAADDLAALAHATL